MNYDYSYIQSVLTSVWPEWRITKLLGKGSYGAVYEIIREDLGSGYKCALKVMEMRAEDLDLTGEVTVQAPAPYSADPHRPYGRSASVSSPRIYSSLTGREGFRQGALARESSPEPERPDPAGQILRGQGTVELNVSGETQTQMLEDFVRGVSREIDLMMRLKGTPNVVSIEDYTVLRGSNIRTILIRMELLEGIDRIAGTKQMSRDEVIKLGVDICSALEVCEKKNILHRDIKPSNIFFSENAGYKLGDFGISRTMASLQERMSMTGVGTVQYMAPEVYLGEKYDHTIDIYSLGLTLYTLLNNNRPPFYASDDPAGREADAGAPASDGGSSGSHSSGSSGTGSRREANMRRLRGEVLPAPARADSRLSSVILTACSADPAMRFQTASAFRNALADCLQSAVAPGPADNPPGRTPASPAPYAPVNKYLLAAAILLTIAGLLFFTRSAGSAGPSADPEEMTASGTGSATTEIPPSQESAPAETSAEAEAAESAEQAVTESAEEPAPAGQAVTGPVEEPSPAYIQWTDHKLEQTVKEQLGISGELTADQAAGVLSLDLKSADLSDISDLRHFTGLQTLDLSDNYIEDLTPLAGLTDLHDLNLEKNTGLTDLSPLAGLTGLRRLDLYRDKVSDLSPLAGMTKLTMLDVRENEISDISVCRDMISMEELYLSSNRGLRDISAVSGMTSLWYLGLKSTQVSDLSPLKTIDSLTHLILAHSNVTSLDPVRDLPRLGFLDIRGCSISSTDTLARLRSRKGLEISE